MNILLITGIFPPDIGGPATYVPQIARALAARGHAITVLTLSDRMDHADGGYPFGVVRLPRRAFRPWRMARTVLALLRLGRRADVLFVNGLALESVLANVVLRKPLVMKVVGDLAWERATAMGWTGDDFETFQKRRYGLRIELLKALRSWWTRRSGRVIVPSHYLRRIVVGWGVPGEKITVIHNAVEPVDGVEPLPVPLTTAVNAVTVGRLVPWKRVDGLLEVLKGVPDLGLVVVGEGPERPRLERLAQDLEVSDRVYFAGQRARKEALGLMAACYLFVLNSTYEGFPHVALEAMALGLPVIATAVGGTPEVVTDGANGRLVDAPIPEAFAKVLAELRDDPAERARLAAGARTSVERWRFERCADAVESLLAELAGPVPARARIVNLGKARVDPTDPATAKKMAIVARHLEATFVTGGPTGVHRVGGVRLVGLPALWPRPLGSAFFYVAAPALATALAAARPGGAVVCQSPFEAAGALAWRRLVPARRRPRVVVELHGDWRTASRLYGHRSRRLVAPAADRIAAAAVRRADRVRAVSAFLESLAREAGYVGPIDRYVTFSEFDAFLDTPPAPLPPEPVALFAGVLQPYKAPEVLLDAWAAVRARLPQARLVLAGEGPMEPALRARAAALGLDGAVEFAGHLPRPELRRRLDAATCLVLPSRSEGLPRLVIEAMARGRPVVGTRAGGIPELVTDGVTGRLVPTDDPAALADALVEVLADPARAAAMGAEARQIGRAHV